MNHGPRGRSSLNLATVLLLVVALVQTTAVALALPDRATAASGTVTNEVGQPLPGIKVVAAFWPADPGPDDESFDWGGGSGVTDAQGHYDFDVGMPDWRIHLWYGSLSTSDPSGEYTAEVRSFGPGSEGTVFTAVNSVGDVMLVSTDPAGTASVAGLVRDDGGAAVLGAEVVLRTGSGTPVARTKTGADGRYTIGWLAAGTYFVDFPDHYVDRGYGPHLSLLGCFYDGAGSLATAASVVLGDAEGVGGIDADLKKAVSVTDLASSTNPNSDVWYPSSQAVFEWAIGDSRGLVVGYRYELHTHPGGFCDPGVPGWSGPIAATEVAFDDVGDGVWYFHLRAEGADGWAYAYGVGVIRIDTTPPVTTDDTDPGYVWYNHAVTVHLRAGDAGSEVALTQWSTDGGTTWVDGEQVTIPADPVAHSGDGEHQVLYRSQDAAGNLEAARSCMVRIDTQGAATVALTRASVRKGRRVALEYRVNESPFPCGPAATVTIRIKNRNGRVVKTLKCGPQTVNTDQKTTFKCRLRVGRYRFWILAVDSALNKQATIGKGFLRVRPAG